MEQLTDVLNSNIGVFSRRDDVEVYKKIKEEIWEETAGPNGREKKQAYHYFHHVFSETPALGGAAVAGTQLIKRHIRADAAKVKLKPLKIKMQSEEARNRLIKQQADNTFHNPRPQPRGIPIPDLPGPPQKPAPQLQRPNVTRPRGLAVIAEANETEANRSTFAGNETPVVAPELMNSIPSATGPPETLPYDFKEVEQKLANINNQINSMMNAGQEEATQDVSPFVQEQLKPIGVELEGALDAGLTGPGVQEVVYESQRKALEIVQEIEKASTEVMQKQESMRESEKQI